VRDATIPHTVLFPDLSDKPLVAAFDEPHVSSDGGAVLLQGAERRYGLIDGFARCLIDDRQSGKVQHSLRDLLAQRIFGIACGYADANDADQLADDPIHKLLLGRDLSFAKTPSDAMREPDRPRRLSWARAVQHQDA
jgi:hypothetical protein